MKKLGNTSSPKPKAHRFSKCELQTITLDPCGKCVKMHISRCYPRYVESESLVLGPWNLHFSSSSVNWACFLWEKIESTIFMHWLFSNEVLGGHWHKNSDLPKGRVTICPIFPGQIWFMNIVLVQFLRAPLLILKSILVWMINYMIDLC